MANERAYSESVRRTYLLLSRATEQTAIALSTFFGAGEHRESGKGGDPGGRRRGGKGRHPGVRRAYATKWAVATLMGYLHQGPCDARIVYAHPSKERIGELWGATDAPLGEYFARGIGGFELDLVICPCEGIRDLLDGYHGGSMSVLAGGDRGAFADPAELAPPDDKGRDLWYFVMTSGSSSKSRDARPLSSAEEGGELTDVLRKSNVVAEVLGGLGGDRKRLLLGVMAIDQPARLTAFLRKMVRLRLFHGSSVAAGLTSHVPKLSLDAFAGLINPTSALLMAAAARSTGGDFLAVPCRRAADTKKSNGKLAYVLPGTKILGARDLVPGKDVFLIGTGITENLLLQGVRFRDHDAVSTHTICLRSGSGSRRFIQQEHALGQRLFHLLRGAPDYTHGPDGYVREAQTGVRYEELLAMMLPH